MALSRVGLIANDAVSNAQIAPNTIIPEDMEDRSITSVKLAITQSLPYSANVTGNASINRSLAVGYTDGRVPQANLDVKGNVVIKPDSVAAGASLSNGIVATTKGVSIGGVAPTAKLSVGGTHTVETIGVTAAGGGGRVIVRATTGTLGTYGSTNNIPVNFLVNNSEIMRITSDGLGIGETVPLLSLIHI